MKISAAFALMLVAGAACAQSFQIIPDNDVRSSFNDPTDGGLGYIMQDLSDDGSTVVGELSLFDDPNDGDYFVWSVPGLIPSVVAPSFIVDPMTQNLSTNIYVSDDGSVIGALADGPVPGILADITAPKGVVDAADVQLFVDQMNANDLESDIHFPSFVIDFFDLLEYMDRLVNGEVNDTPVAVPSFWTVQDGWVNAELFPNESTCGPMPYGSIFGLSGDGTTATGYMWSGLCSSVLFTAERGGATTQILSPNLLADPDSRDRMNASPVSARCINDDGSVVGGFFQTINRAPAAWFNGQFVRLDDDGEMTGEVNAMNGAGTILAGTTQKVGLLPDGTFDVDDGFLSVWHHDGSGGFVLQPETIQTPGGATLPPYEEGVQRTGFTLAYVSDMTANGKVIVGSERLNNGVLTPWIYREGFGMMDGTDFLEQELGVSLPDLFEPNIGFTLPIRIMSISFVSDDGTVIAGYARAETAPFDFAMYSWIATVPQNMLPVDP